MQPNLTMASKEPSPTILAIINAQDVLGMAGDFVELIGMASRSGRDDETQALARAACMAGDAIKDALRLLETAKAALPEVAA